MKGNNFTLNQENLTSKNENENIDENKMESKEQDDLLLRTSETENISIDKENNIIKKEIVEKNVEIQRYEYYNTSNK